MNMWSLFSKQTIVESNILNGMTDYHSHVLPGVDDGVSTSEKAFELLAFYEELGIRHVWLTPHIMEDIPNTTEGLKERFAKLNAAYQGNITLLLAAENMLDNLFEERLAKNDLLPLGKDGKHLLVETSYFNPPMGLNNILLRIKSKGYVPILAHPERYVYMDEDDYKHLKSIGVRLQANLPSLLNTYGTDARRKVEWMIREHLIDMWGTDTHHFHAISQLVMEKQLKQSIAITLKSNRK